MSRRSTTRGGDESRTLPRRLAALTDAVALSRQRLPAAAVDAAAAVAARASERWRLAPDATVVALAGSTGSGKSSLLNALAGADVAPVGVRRPTTSAALAAVDLGDTDEESLQELLQWLEVRTQVPAGLSGGPSADAAGSPTPPSANDVRDGAAIVVMDLPDTDSVREAHRLQVDRLVTQVDLLVWVVDPQKYADAVLHERYLRPLRHAADVTVVVLNQVDALSLQAREACVDDLRRLLRQDGLEAVDVLCTSATTGEGIPALRARILQAATTRQAAARRISGEVEAAATRLAEAASEPGEPTADGVTDRESRTTAVPARRSAGATHVARRRRRDLVVAMEGAAGVPVVVDAVERAVVARAVARVGWPPVRWLRRLRPDPLRRLRVEPANVRSAGFGKRAASAEPATPIRTSLPPASAAARSEVDNAVRFLVDDLRRTLPVPWVDAVRARLHADEAMRTAALDAAVAQTDLGAAKPLAAARVLGPLQWLVTVAAVGGASWLVALAVIAWLRLPQLLTPTLDVAPGPRSLDLALPTLLLVGGVVVGLLLAALGRALARFAGRRRARSAQRRLTTAVTEVARERVLAPLDEELARHAQLLDRLDQARRDGT